jgi:hypothetical protein
MQKARSRKDLKNLTLFFLSDTGIAKCLRCRSLYD